MGGNIYYFKIYIFKNGDTCVWSENPLDIG